MDENLNKNIPEEEIGSETTKTAETEELSEETLNPADAVPAEEIAETEPEAEITKTEPEIADDSNEMPVEVITATAESRPAGLLRSAITAVIVLAVFAAVYFIYTALNPEEKTHTQPSKPKTEMSVSQGVENGEETAGADTNASDKNASTGNIQSKTEEAPSPEYTNATDKITEAARKKYGNNLAVLPEYNSQLKTVKINGSERKCYMAAAVLMTGESGGGMPIIHAAFDAQTGEIWFGDETQWEVLD